MPETRRRPVLSAIAAVLALPVLLAAAPAEACGPDSDCRIGERTYRIALPDDRAGRPAGALIFAHGYRGTARGVMNNQALRAFAAEKGLALVAPKSAEEDWMIPGVPKDPAATGAREMAYFDALIGDLQQRFGIDPGNLIVAGFSAGGMMTWTLACRRGDRFRAFVPIAGTYWAPVPETCPTAPANLVHVHGLSDRVVPVSGRAIAETRQGDVRVALDRARAQGGFGAARHQTLGDLDCAVRLNAAGALLAFCTHSGGHALKSDYLRAAWQILQGAGAL